MGSKHSFFSQKFKHFSILKVGFTLLRILGYYFIKFLFMKLKKMELIILLWTIPIIFNLFNWNETYFCVLWLLSEINIIKLNSNFLILLCNIIFFTLKMTLRVDTILYFILFLYSSHSKVDRTNDFWTHLSQVDSLPWVHRQKLIWYL